MEHALNSAKTIAVAGLYPFSAYVPIFRPENQKNGRFTRDFGTSRCLPLLNISAPTIPYFPRLSRKRRKAVLQKTPDLTSLIRRGTM